MEHFINFLIPIGILITLGALFIGLISRNKTVLNPEKRSITRVWLDESVNECEMCGACEASCPEVFEVPEKMIVKVGADFQKHATKIIEASDGCPVSVIAIELDKSRKRDYPAQA